MGYYQRQYQEEKLYAYHDIDMHADTIRRSIQRDNMESYRYAVCSPLILKESEVVIPGYKDGTKVRLSTVKGDDLIYTKALTVKNLPNIINEFGLAVNPKLSELNGNIVHVEEV